MSAQVRTHYRFLGCLDLVRLVVVLATIHGISGRVLFVRPVEVSVDSIFGIDLVRYRLRRRGWSIPFTAGNDWLQLRPAATATMARLRRFAVYGQSLRFPALLTVAGRRHRHHFLTCNRKIMLLK